MLLQDHSSGKLRFLNHTRRGKSLEKVGWPIQSFPRVSDLVKAGFAYVKARRSASITVLRIKERAESRLVFAGLSVNADATI